MIGTSDTTLAAMLWEEGLAPADAAEHWVTSSVTRCIKPGCTDLLVMSG